MVAAAGDRGSPDASAADQARMAFVLRLRERGIADVNVLRALEMVPRETFVPRRYADLAWRDLSLPIACGQIMPDAFVVARVMEALALSDRHRVLEIGAGSGYATAILARLAGSIVSFERYRSLALEAQERLKASGTTNVALEWGDGFEAARKLGQFDRILVHLALDAPPADLLGQLAPGGRLLCGLSAAPGRPPCLAIFGAPTGAPQAAAIIAEARLTQPMAGVSEAL